LKLGRDRLPSDFVTQRRKISFVLSNRWPAVGTGGRQQGQSSVVFIMGVLRALRDAADGRMASIRRRDRYDADRDRNHPDQTAALGSIGA